MREQNDNWVWLGWVADAAKGVGQVRAHVRRTI